MLDFLRTPRHVRRRACRRQMHSEEVDAIYCPTAAPTPCAGCAAPEPPAAAACSAAARSAANSLRRKNHAQRTWRTEEIPSGSVTTLHAKKQRGSRLFWPNFWASLHRVSVFGLFLSYGSPSLGLSFFAVLQPGWPRSPKGPKTLWDFQPRQISPGASQKGPKVPKVQEFKENQTPSLYFYIFGTFGTFDLAPG